MRKDIKELADAMQKGWKKVPRNTRRCSFAGPENNPSACCPLVHAIVGKTGKASWYNDSANYFPVLNKQKVDSMSLKETILKLADVYEWTTPQVIRWLRSHQNELTA